MPYWKHGNDNNHGHYHDFNLVEETMSQTTDLLAVIAPPILNRVEYVSDHPMEVSEEQMIHMAKDVIGVHCLGHLALKETQTMSEKISLSHFVASVGGMVLGCKRLIQERGFTANIVEPLNPAAFAREIIESLKK